MLCETTICHEVFDLIFFFFFFLEFQVTEHPVLEYIWLCEAIGESNDDIYLLCCINMFLLT